MNAKAPAQESPLKTLKDVMFAYSSVTYPNPAYDPGKLKVALSDNPLELHSYEIKVVVTEKVFKSLKKAFKGAINITHAKDFTPEEAEDKLGIEVDEDIVLIKFSQTCMSGKEGSRKPSKPITQIGIKGRVQDKNGEAIDQDTRLGNGTKGHFQFNPVETQNGLYLYPVALCITELVVMAESASGPDESAFGVEELDEVASDDFSEDFDDNIDF
jgi:hypothetical protein